VGRRVFLYRWKESVDPGKAFGHINIALSVPGFLCLFEMSTQAAPRRKPREAATGFPQFFAA
jgi:hypothetical protein